MKCCIRISLILLKPPLPCHLQLTSIKFKQSTSGMGLVSAHDECKMTEITVWWFKYQSLIYTKSNWHGLICPFYCSRLAELQIKTQLCYVKGTCTHNQCEWSEWISVNVSNSSSVWRGLYEFCISGPVRIFYFFLIPLIVDINMFLSYLSYSLF